MNKLVIKFIETSLIHQHHTDTHTHTHKPTFTHTHTHSTAMNPTTRTKMNSRCCET
uniref:GH10751p n=1 Tax=Drosophila melanogaster TaxID=7227 RepID=Q95T95_DROME|nr:GH10751p [Drosophila melanogaster]